MKTKIKVILITMLVLLLLVLGLVFAINKRNESIKYFHNGGYIIGNVYESNGEIQTIHFEENSKYKKHSDNEYKITDVDGNKTTVKDEMFVHYTDNSIMALKKGVAIDLNAIDSNLLKYYNIFQEAVLQKTNDGYEIKNIEEIITFNKLMFKLSENKYLIAAENIIAYFSEDQTITFKDFVEIEYVNENVIKIYNNENNYQSISSGLYILIDNIKIDLEYKTIEKNKIEYLTMADLNINSDDNIEILPEKEQEETKDEEQEKVPEKNPTNNSENSGSNNNGGGNIQQDNIDSSILEGLTPIGPNETLKEDSVVQPKFTVENLDVTMLGFENLTISMVDESGILYGDSKVTIIENSTGKEVASLSDWVDGNSNYLVNSYYGLKPDTEYTLTVTGKYEIEDTIYDRVYVSKMFRTLDIGLEILGDCATSDSLSFAIYKMDYSNIEAISYDLLDSAGKSVLNATKKINYRNSDYVIASVDGLNANSKYTFVVKNIQYGDDIISTDNVTSLQMTYDMKTLKQRPDLEVSLSADVNLLKNQIILNIDNIKDTNKGIKSYKYKIYSNDGTDFNQKEPVYVVTKDDSSEVVVNISESLEQGDSYYFNVEIEFDDNEKTLIYNTQYSDPVYTSDIVYPKVINYVSAENVNCEELVGFLNIDDKEGFIKINNINEYQVVLREKGNALSTETYDQFITLDGSLQTDYITLPVSFKNLKPNTEYVLYTYLRKGTKTMYIGYVTVKTTETSALYLVMENIETEESIDSKLFKFTMDLPDSYFDELDANMSNIYNYIKNNLSYINLDLRGCNKNQCIPLSFEKSISNSNNSQELTSLLEGNVLSLDSSHFNFFADDYRSDYESYKLYIKASSFAGYEIPIYIDDEKTNYFDLKIIDNIPTLEVKTDEIVNMESPIFDETLDDTTVVGYKLQLKETYSTKGIGIHEFNYRIYEYNGDCENVNEAELGTSVRNGNILLDETFNKDHVIDVYFVDGEKPVMYRGKKYCLIYDSNFKSEGNEEPKPTSSGKLNLTSNKQSVKIFGSLTKYEDTNITFKLKVDDNDASIKNIYLKRDGDYQTLPLAIKQECQNKYCEYDFTISKLTNLTKFGLYIEHQKNEETEMENLKIYEFSLDEIKQIPETVNLNIKNENSKLIFTIDGLDPTLDVFGLKLTSTDLDGKIKEKYLDLEKKDLISGEIIDDGMETPNSVVRYEASINNSNLSDYGIEKNGYIIKADNLKLELIYNDGSVDLDSSSFVSIKQANTNLDNVLYYYNNYSNKSLFENKTLLNSVYYKEPLKNFVTDLQINLKDLSYDSSDKTGTTIGQSLSSSLVHLYKTSLKDLTFNKEDVIVDAVLSTQNQITYTTKGAYIDFNVVDPDVFGTLSKVKFNLNCNGAEDFVEWIWNKETNKWTYPNGTDHIEAIDKKDNKIISVGVKNINEYNNCTYSLQYTKNSSEEVLMSINSENNESNTGVITSFKVLSVDNKLMEYETKYWKKNGDETDLLFNKNLRYEFNVIKNYSLIGNEELRYDVVVSDGVSGEISILEDQLINVSNISKVVDLYNYIKPDMIKAGVYKLIIKPYVINHDENITYELLPFEYENNLVVSTQKPDFSALAYQDVVYLSIEDVDGVFAPWEDTNSYSGVNLEETNDNLKDTIYENKKYYFEILSGDRVVAYKPMSFITQTQSIVLKDLFGSTLSNGTYNTRICYYSILSDDKECSGNVELKLMSSNTLNATIMKLTKSYLLDLDNPELSIKDNMGGIKYIATYNNGTRIENTLTDLEFITRVSSSGSVSYFIELQLLDGLTSDVRQFEVTILDKENKPITTILYK